MRARLERRWVGRRWPAPSGPARAAGVCPAAIAGGVLPPGPEPAVPRPWARLRGDRRFGSRPAGPPPGVHMPPVVCQGGGFLLLGSGIGGGLLLRQWTRMPHHKAPVLLGAAPIAVFDLHLSAHTLAMPAAWFCGLRPAGFLPPARQDRRLRAPYCQGLPHGTGARGAGGLRGVCLRPRERHGRRVLMEPRGRERRDRQRFEGDHAKDLMEMRGKQGLEDMAETVIGERGPGQLRLQQRHHPPCFQSSPHLREGMRSIQNGEDQGFDATSAREPRRRMRRASTAAYSSGPPLSRKNRVVQSHPLNVG
jgi:hypothetical protein